MAEKPIAVVAAVVPPRARLSGYPAYLLAKVQRRERRVLGDLFGLASFGVNLTTLKPGAQSSPRHAHTVQDEFFCVLTGAPVLVTDAGEPQLSPGTCAGFKGGSGDAHCLVNRTTEDALVLEVGDRLPGDGATNPEAGPGGGDGRGRQIPLQPEGRNGALV